MSEDSQIIKPENVTAHMDLERDIETKYSGWITFTFKINCAVIIDLLTSETNVLEQPAGQVTPNSQLVSKNINFHLLCEHWIDKLQFGTLTVTVFVSFGQITLTPQTIQISTSRRRKYQFKRTNQEEAL